MLIAKNNLRDEFDTLFETIKDYATQGKSYIDIYKIISSRFSGTRQQFYALYRKTQDLKTIQKLLDDTREKKIVELLYKGEKISHISQCLNVARSVVYDKAKKHNIDVTDKIITVKKIPDDVFIPKKIHDAIPDRQNKNFATFVYKNRHAEFASDDQCANIFTAIDSRGDYWCGNYRDADNKNKQSSRYCKQCQGIVFSKLTKKITNYG
jgi:hypothetical protein